MKWFDRWFYRKARWCWHRAGVAYPEVKAEQDFIDKLSLESNHSNEIELNQYTARSMVCISEEIAFERPMCFKVAAAEGGMIVEVSYYDAKNDRSITKHHIVADDVADKAHAIAKIVTWEFMKQPQQ
jgi:hypothetical protein